MGLRSIGMKTMLTATIAAGIAIAAQMPAQAAAIAGKTFSFHGTASLLSETNATTTLDFSPSFWGPNNDGQASLSYAASEQGVAEWTYARQFQIKDIPLVKTATGWSLMGGLLNWIDINQGLGFGYVLNSFNMNKTANNSFEALIDGIFTPENLGTVDGSFTSQKRLASLIGTSFSAEMTALGGSGTGDNGDNGNTIPTPALLPGLLGMGAAIVRKRQAAA